MDRLFFMIFMINTMMLQNKYKLYQNDWYWDMTELSDLF